MTFHVKTRFLFVLALVCGHCAPAAETPDARAILQDVRAAQKSQSGSVSGKLRTGWKSVPFQLSMTGDTIRWEFSDPPQTLLLRLGARDARLEESGKGGVQQVQPARFDEKVRGSDISYEDLAMRFLYWPKAAVEGEQTMVLQKCWIVRVEPPSAGDSQYSAVKLWVAKNSGALMQAEAFGRDGKLARRFKVISGGQMRIESMDGTSKDAVPSYIELDKR